jgi:predicted TPR repeat methyltransferase
VLTPLALAAGCAPPPNQHVMSLSQVSSVRLAKQSDELAAAGKPSEALEALRRAEALAPDQPDVQWRMAVTAAAAGDLDLALAALDRLLRVEPQAEQSEPVRQLIGLIERKLRP